MRQKNNKQNRKISPELSGTLFIYLFVVIY